MAESKTLLVLCSCSKRKTFEIVVPLASQQGGTERHFIQVICPNSKESWCIKDLTISLPPGLVPEKDRVYLRGTNNSDNI